METVLGKGFLDLPAFNLADIIAKAMSAKEKQGSLSDW